MVVISDSKHVFIPRGISGSGKSTLANKWFSPHEIWGADRLREELVGTLIHNVPKIDKAAFEALDKILEVQAKNGVTIFVDNTNLSNISGIHKIFREQDYKIHHI